MFFLLVIGMAAGSVILGADDAAWRLPDGDSEAED